MKELQQQIQDKVVITGQKEQEKKLQLVGSFNLQKGQRVFELDIDTGMIRHAEFSDVIGTIRGAVHRKLIIKPKHLYCAAINFKNADRKFVKMIS